MDKLSREQKKGILWLNTLFTVVVALVLYSFASLLVNFFICYVIDGASLFFPFLSDENILWFVPLPEFLSFFRFSVGQLLDIFLISNIILGIHRLYIFRRDYRPDVSGQIFFSFQSCMKKNPNPYHYSPGFNVELTPHGKHVIISESKFLKKRGLKKEWRIQKSFNVKISIPTALCLIKSNSRSFHHYHLPEFARFRLKLNLRFCWNRSCSLYIAFASSSEHQRAYTSQLLFNFPDSQIFNEEGVAS